MSSLNDLILNYEKSSNFSIVLPAVWILTEAFPLITRGPTVIAQYADTKMAHEEHDDIIGAVLRQVSEIRITRFSLETHNSYNSDKRQLYKFEYDLNNGENKKKAIWFVDGLNSFRRLEEDLLEGRNLYFRNGFFCIVYTGRESNRLDSIRTIFQRLFQIYVVNINVLMTFGKTVHVYTYFPFTETSCHNIEPHIQGIFGPTTNYQFSSRNFFPKKLLNMWGCEVNVTTWTEAPFIKIEYNKTSRELISLEGIEGRLILLLSDRMNFSIQIVEEPAQRVGDGILPGSIKMLVDGLTNISIAGFMQDKTRAKLTQPVYNYISVPLIFAIPLGKMMTPLERLYRPFNLIVWISLSSSLLVGICVIFTLKSLCNSKVQEFVFGHKNHMALTNFWRTLYGSPIANALPRRNFARYLLAVWVLYTFVIRSGYIAQLFLILRDSRSRNEIHTVDEILKQNLTFYSFPITAPVLLDAAKQDIHLNYLYTNGSFFSKLLDELSQDENANCAAVLTGYNIQIHNQLPKNRLRPINTLREPLLNAPITFYMRKNSYLVDEINESLLKIMSAGLIKQFEELTLPQHRYVTQNTEVPQAISLFLLTGLFFLHFVLLILSTLVFLLELWSKNSPLTRRLLELLNL